MKALELHTVLCFMPSSRGWNGILRPARAGRPPSRAAPGTRLAGRTRPRGPGSLYTVRHDLDGHGGRARSDARTTALVFCAGVLCGSCVAPCSPWGLPSRRRELDPRGAPRLCTGAGPEGHGLMNTIQSLTAIAGARYRLESLHSYICYL